MSASLSVVASNPAREPGAETLAERIRRLQAEAAMMAREHIEELEHKLDEVRQLSEDIAEGGSAYPVGAREVARRLVEESSMRAQTLDAIVSRTA
jgi:hypothetical protein